ncbi:hypothetical protein NP233_g8561 [Leucocoprinus birnbaumii]|uniref:DUF6534 domain-containing protein n=1 Tax=Leucocoprinus birnbaumii TaxID=56174 RepID=A0AAD5YTM3_9AGAR|nr:hypothetical protein NP233_g8561 [Leucocoprinus birnbaumii]
MIKTLSTIAINTGVILSISALAVFVLFFLTVDAGIYLGIFWPSSKLYFNSLIASLNSRDFIRKQGKSEGAISISTGIRMQQSSLLQFSDMTAGDSEISGSDGRTLGHKASAGFSKEHSSLAHSLS